MVTGDLSHADDIKSYFTTEHYSVTVNQRPSLVYGVNANLSNGKSVFLSTHGDKSGSKLLLDEGVYFTGSNITGSVSSKFVFYSACCSAKPNSTTNINLCARTVTNGAKVCVGYYGSVTVVSAKYYENRFYENLVKYKYSFTNSYYYAITSTQNYFPDYDTSSSAANLVRLYGNGSLKLY